MTTGEIIGVASGLTVMVLLFRVIFGNSATFWESVKFWLTPDIFSWLNGNGFADFLGELRLFLWFGAGFGTFFLVAGLFS